MTKYGNAEKILPKYVLDTVRQYFPKGMLWVPPDGSPGICEMEIARLAGKGLGSAEIAERVGRSQRRVNQILKKRKARQEAARERAEEKRKALSQGAENAPVSLEFEDITINLDGLEQSLSQGKPEQNIILNEEE